MSEQHDVTTCRCVKCGKKLHVCDCQPFMGCTCMKQKKRLGEARWNWICEVRYKQGGILPRK